MSNPFKKAAQTRKAPGNSNFIQSFMNDDTHDLRRGSKELIHAYNTTPWLRAVVNEIAFKTASVGWRIYVGRDQSGKAVQRKDLTRLSNINRKSKIKEAIQDDELEEVTEHPMLGVLNNMNPKLVGQQGKKLTQVYLDLVGKVFWLIDRNEMGMPVNLFPFPKNWVMEETREYVRVTMPDSITYKIPRTEIVMFSDPDPMQPYGRGSAPAMSLDDELRTDEFAAKHIKAFFENSARPDLLVYGDMQKPHVERLKKGWLDKIQGFKNAYLPHFLPSGDKLEIKELSQSFKDMELVQLREYERDTVRQVFGVPPEILGIVDNSNRATIEAADLIMVKYVLIPRLELHRATLQQRLVPEYDENIIIDYENPIPEDKEYQKDLMKNHQWAFTRNEIRQAAGKEPLDDDIFVLPNNKRIINAENGEVIMGQTPKSDQEKNVKKKPNNQTSKSLLRY